MFFFLISERKLNKNRDKMAVYKQKKNRAVKANRFLISVTVVGSAGPIRFVVNEDEPVSAVIDHALKAYAREGRLPLLGSDFNNFMLYSPISGTEALLPWETIGSFGVRNFFLCKKPQTETVIAIYDDKASQVSKKGGGSWKSWFHKSLNLKISLQ
ncbi:phospholipase D gamma 3 [Striga asiatica]|uniref:Phospholipase D gamma 3 n=1 Tax=Striga asiatica TaxID=4170 RepID=A0A5A7PXD2_STRAF|nr:phospholipase D gamma 3 [Striga asiatica]